MHICFTLWNVKWCLDGDCSNHITEDKYLFSSFTPKNGGFALYGDREPWVFAGIIMPL